MYTNDVLSDEINGKILIEFIVNNYKSNKPFIHFIISGTIWSSFAPIRGISTVKTFIVLEISFYYILSKSIS